jgi:hypothetical protein
MAIEALIRHARRYCDWAESDTHDMETVYQILLSLRDGAEQLPASSVPKETCAMPPSCEEVPPHRETRRFADFPFQCYYPSYWPDRPLPLTDNIHVNFAWIHAELQRGLQASDQGELTDVIRYWHHSYLFRWGHHVSAAVWAIEWHKDGEPDAPPNSRPPSQLPLPPRVPSSDSQRAPGSGGCG